MKASFSRPAAFGMLVLSLSFAACSTTSGGSGFMGGGSDERKEIVGLEEMSLEYIQTLWGEADQNVPSGKGRTVRFKNIRAEDEDPISGAVAVKYCDVKLEVNEKQLVSTWNYEVCRPKK